MPASEARTLLSVSVSVGREEALYKSRAGMVLPSASSSHECCYGGLQIHKSYPRLIHGSVILDQKGSRFLGDRLIHRAAYVWVYTVIIIVLKWQYCAIASEWCFIGFYAENPWILTGSFLTETLWTVGAILTLYCCLICLLNQMHASYHSQCVRVTFCVCIAGGCQLSLFRDQSAGEQRPEKG